MHKLKDVFLNPLVRWSLAIACGLVLAHVVNEMVDFLLLDSLKNFVAGNSWMLFDLGIGAGLLTLIVWKRRTLLAWCDAHRTMVVAGSFLVFALVALAVIHDANQQHAAAAPVTLDFSKAIPIK
jgi:uncharacterized membrane protein